MTPSTIWRGTFGSSTIISTTNATSVMPRMICSITTVPAMVGIRSVTPSSFCTRRRSTNMRPTSPSLATSAAFNRKPTKMAGITCRYWNGGWSGIVSRLAFQTTPLNQTEPKLAISAAITSGTDSVLKMAQASMIC